MLPILAPLPRERVFQILKTKWLDPEDDYENSQRECHDNCRQDDRVRANGGDSPTI